MTDIATVAADLKNAYLHIFDSFATDPSEFVGSAASGSVNLRYARELFATLVNADLVAVTDVNEEGADVWQTCPNTYDDIDRTEAERVIDAWLAEHTNPGSPSPTTATKTPGEKMPTFKDYHPCGCGCGENVPPKSFYRPGHDARHAGQVGREIAANVTVPGYDRREILATLPTEALRTKAERIAEKAIEKIEAKAVREVAKARKSNPADEALKANVTGKVESGEAEPIVETPVTEEGIIKVGKNEYVARRNTLNGRVDYFKDDEIIEASKTAAKTFQVG